MGAGLSGGQADDNDVEGSGFLSLSQRSAYHFIYACHSYYDKPMRKGYGPPFLQIRKQTPGKNRPCLHSSVGPVLFHPKFLLSATSLGPRIKSAVNCDSSLAKGRNTSFSTTQRWVQNPASSPTGRDPVDKVASPPGAPVPSDTCAEDGGSAQ